MKKSDRAKFHRDFERALTFATRLHAGQTRKQTDIPYISHLVAVAGIVIEHGGERDEAIAALLHDAIEDQGPDYSGGSDSLRRAIAGRFGARVLSIVEGCTDADTDPKPEWQERKARYVAHIAHAGPSVRLVSCADKLHNARAIVSDLRVIGSALFNRFNGKKKGTLWYYRALARKFLKHGPEELAHELDRTVRQMERLS